MALPMGFEDEVTNILEQLIGGTKRRKIISIFGMPGLGKTTLAKKLYHDPSTVYYFDKLAWCSVSQRYCRRELLVDILMSIGDLRLGEILEKDEASLSENLYKSLKGRRYFLVMDDIWNVDAWNDLKQLLPDDKIGSRILFTSRVNYIGFQASPDSVTHALPFLLRDQCWELLQRKVFKQESCPEELLDIGYQIAGQCHGLPLSVVVIAAVLANMEKKASLWREISGCLKSHISQDPTKCMNILELSYMHLPSHLKPCFLYFGALQEGSETPARKLIWLWIAKGFIRKEENRSLHDVAEDYLRGLIERSLVIVTKRRSDGGVKACIIHDLLLDLCLRIAREENFLKLIEQYLAVKSMPAAVHGLKNLMFLLVTNIGVAIPQSLLYMVKLRHLRLTGGAYFDESCYKRVIKGKGFHDLESISRLWIRNQKDEKILSSCSQLRKLKCTWSSFWDPVKEGYRYQC